MFVSELQIINFRNLQFLRAEFGTGINLLHGTNAQGKTNLLEAVYLLVTGRSFRTTLDREMIPWMREDYEATLVRARVHKRGGDDRMLLTFNQGGKHVFVNGVALTRLGELLGRLNCVLFTPSELALVSGPPGGRRRFLDVELSQVSRPYLYHLQHYDLALRQSNALLKQHQHRPSLRGELRAWHAQLAAHGAGLAVSRRQSLERLAALSAKRYADIAGNGEELAIEYQPSPRGSRKLPGWGSLRTTRGGPRTHLRRRHPSRGDFSRPAPRRFCIHHQRARRARFRFTGTAALMRARLEAGGGEPYGGGHGRDTHPHA